MSIPHPLDADPCTTALRWKISLDLAYRLDELQGWGFDNLGLLFPGLYIISGFRSSDEQLLVNPFAPLSQHTVCPALAVDVRVGTVPASLTEPQTFSALGLAWEGFGGRWGGRFADPDPNHFGSAIDVTSLATPA